MRSILKALGLTIWGAIAIGLAVIFIVVGYELALKYRFSINSLSFEKALNSQSSQSQPVEPAGSVALPTRAPELPVPVAKVQPRAAEETDCAKALGIPRVSMDSQKKARLQRILDTADAAKSEYGDAFIRLGEVYYGFGEYELALAAIERGLQKGHVKHLDDAYVYLGRSEVAVGDLDAARDAFAKLSEVSNISQRVVQLWVLYAETLSRTVEQSTVSPECVKRAP